MTKSLSHACAIPAVPAPSCVPLDKSHHPMSLTSPSAGSEQPCLSGRA